jgi:hypothetical protein
MNENKTSLSSYSDMLKGVSQGGYNSNSSYLRENISNSGDCTVIKPVIRKAKTIKVFMMIF